MAFGNAIKSPENKLCDSSDGFASFGDDFLGKEISRIGEIEGEDTREKLKSWKTTFLRIFYHQD